MKVVFSKKGFSKLVIQTQLVFALFRVNNKNAKKFCKIYFNITMETGNSKATFSMMLKASFWRRYC